MIDLRIGDEVFGPTLEGDRTPKACTGLAFFDSGGQLWTLVPKAFFEQTGGEIFSDRARSTPFSASSPQGVRSPSGGFVAIQVLSAVTLAPHGSTPTTRPPAVLDQVSIGSAPGQVSG